MNSEKSRSKRKDLLTCFDRCYAIKIEFKSQISGELQEVLCSRPPSVKHQNIDNARLAVYRIDTNEYEDIAWSSIKSWTKNGKVKTTVVGSLEA